MTKNMIQRFRRAGATIAVCIVALVLMIAASACAGVAGTTSISGSVASVDAQHHSVSIKVNGQTFTINGLSAQQLAQLQSQISKTFSFNVTQNSDGTYTVGSDPNSVTEEGTPEANNNETPTVNEPQGVNEPGSISFIGKVQSVSSSSIVVSLPDGSTLSMIVNTQTDKSEFNSALPGVGQTISVDASANTDGSFTATKLGTIDSSDNATLVTYQGVTTSAVGSDHVIHFKVGNRSFGFAIGSSADLGDFNGNAQSIANNVSVKLDVQFQGNTGTVTKVSSSNG